MGADNWAVCPKCEKNAADVKKKANDEAQASYGKVSSAKFLSLVAAADALPSEEDSETLREDYEIGVSETGDFYVVYSCSCTRCGFDFKFKSEKNILK